LSEVRKSGPNRRRENKYHVDDRFVCQEWIDEFLVWRPEDYGGLDKIVVDPMRIWVPKLATGNRSVNCKILSYIITSLCSRNIVCLCAQISTKYKIVLVSLPCRILTSLLQF